MATGTCTAPTRPATSARSCGTIRALVYVPNSMSNTVDVISQRTFKIVEQFPVGALPQHVTPVLRPADAVRRQRPRQQPHADQPADRPPWRSDTGRGSVQPVLHPRRPVRDRRRRTPPAPRFPRSAHDAPRPFAVGARVPRRRSHGLLRGRALRVRELRVRRPDDRDRPTHPAGDSDPRARSAASRARRT